MYSYRYSYAQRRLVFFIVIFPMLKGVPFEFERDLDPEPAFKFLGGFIPATSESKHELRFAGPTT